MNKENIYLSSNIKHLRNKNGKTQQDLANFCKKTNTAISNWEKGIREPDNLDLANIAEYFNISIDDLMLKDFRLPYSSNNQPHIIYKDQETGLTVAFLHQTQSWNELPKEKQEAYISEAMDSLYEYKRNLKEK